MKKNIFFILCSFLFGGAFVFVVYNHLESNHIDSRKIQTAQAIHDTSEIRKDIAGKLLNDVVLSDYFYKKNEIENTSSLIELLYQDRDGDLIMKLSNGSIIWFHPEKKNGVVIWHCFGGSDQDVPTGCRNKTYHP